MDASPSHDAHGSDEEDANPTQEDGASDDANPSPRKVDDASSDVDSVNAPTLVLGGSDGSVKEISDVESEESFQCSQVSSGWLGKTYNAVNKMEREENAKAKFEACLVDLECDVKEQDLISPSMLDSYMTYCRRTLHAYGLTFFATLSSESHILSWIRRQKSVKDLGKNV